MRTAIVAARRGPFRAMVALSFLAVAAACGPDEAPSESTTPPAPRSSPPTTPRPEPSMPPEPTADFYDVPDPLPAGEPGEPIWAERVAAPAGAIAWRVLYHSRSVRGEDIAVSGLVVAPSSPPPEGGFPVLAYAHGTTGLADTCAPSRDARPLGEADDEVGSFPLPALWEAGWVVAATDYEGLGTPGRHPYLVGESEGRGVLDSVRAARALPEAQAGARSVVVGVSQGGHAALFTGEIAPAYAPDAGLVGVVALAPGAELAHAALLLTGDESVVGFGVAIAAGFAAADPDIDLSSVLTERALERLDVVDSGCIDDVLATFEGPAERTLRLEHLLHPPWPGLLEANTPGRVPTSVPVFVGQGEADALVIPELTDALVARLCALGNDVTYRRYPGASHGAIVEAARDDALSWIAARFEGKPSGVGTDAGDCPG